MSEGKSLTIGEREVRVTRFRAFKAFVAGDIMAQIGDEVEALVEKHATFQRDYRENHQVRLDKKTSHALGYDIPDSEFGDGDDGFIMLPASPSDEEVFFHLFPAGFKVARDQIIKLIGLVVISNDDLQAAEGDENVGEVLDARGKELLFEGDIEDILRLVLVTVEAVKDQLSGLDEVLGKLRGLLQPRVQEEDQTAIPSETVIEQKTGGDESPPPSSTSSPASTDGGEETSSSEPLGATSSS